MKKDMEAHEVPKMTESTRLGSDGVKKAAHLYEEHIPDDDAADNALLLVALCVAAALCRCAAMGAN